MNGSNGYSKPKTDLDKLIQKAVEQRLPQEVEKALAKQAEDAEKKDRRAATFAAGQAAYQKQVAEKLTGRTLEDSLKWFRENGFDV